jgi:hypothetical protein
LGPGAGGHCHFGFLGAEKGEPVEFRHLRLDFNVRHKVALVLGRRGPQRHGPRRLDLLKQGKHISDFFLGGESKMIQFSVAIQMD